MRRIDVKRKKTERIAGMVRILSENPNQLYTLTYFSELFSCAKSTLSEDIMLIKTVFEEMELGSIMSYQGASGGVKYIPSFTEAQLHREKENFVNILSDTGRILPGHYLYVADIVSDPQHAFTIAKIIATMVDYSDADYLVTLEAKGIPLGFMAARLMNIPLCIIRKNIMITEGSSISISSKVSATGLLQTLSLPQRSIEKGKKVIIVDDFINDGHSMASMEKLVKEFNAEVIEKICFIDVLSEKEKLIKNYRSILSLKLDDNDFYVKETVE